jgi:ankyrin repeat protein
MQNAAVGGHEAVVRLLLNFGAQINIQGEGKRTALQAAVSGGNEAVVRLLLDEGADTRLLEVEGKHALFDAADQGYEAIIRLLLHARANVDYRWGRWGPAICAAADEDEAAIVRLLLDFGADVDLCGEFMDPALLIAAKLGHEATVRVLIDGGATITLQGRGPYEPNTALQWAVYNRHEVIVRLLLDANPIPKTSIGPHSASGTNFGELTQGCSIDAAIDAGQALCIACDKGFEGCVIMLLEAGAHTNAGLDVESYGISALSNAATRNYEGIMQILLDVAGVEVDARRRNGSTALHDASHLGTLQAVQTLLDRGANPLLRDANGYTPLMMAVGTGRKEVAQTIWQAVPDTPQEEIFAGALFYASMWSMDDVVRRLLNDELNMDDATSRRRDWNEELFGSFEQCLTLALSAAVRYDSTDIVQALTDAGADPSDPYQGSWEAPFPFWRLYTIT